MPNSKSTKFDNSIVCLLFQVYIVDLIRKPLPRYVKFVDPKKALEFECPISLSPLYRPITVKGSNPKHTYSAPFMDSVTRTSKVDLLNGQALPPDWRVVDRELEAKMSAEPAVIPLTYGGMLTHPHQSAHFDLRSFTLFIFTRMQNSFDN